MDRHRITITIGGRQKTMNKSFWYFACHRDHIYYLAGDAYSGGIMLNRIQVSNINPDDIEVENFCAVPQMTHILFDEITANDKYNRLCIFSSTTLLILNLEHKIVERHIQNVYDYNSEHALSMNNDTKLLTIYDLHSESNTIEFDLSMYNIRGWPLLARNYIIVSTYECKYVFTVKGKFYLELHEEEKLIVYNDVSISVTDGLIVVHDQGICRYDTLRFNAIKQTNALVCGDICKNVPPVQTFMRSELFERHVLPLIKQFLHY